MSELEKRKIPKYPNYSATKCGRVFRISTGKEMKRYPSGSSKYLAFRACHNNKPKTVYVHVAVALAWLHNSDESSKTQVNHIDGNKLNNHADNLEWVTPSENQRHAIYTGLKGRGQELYNASLNEDQVHLICQMLEQGALVNDLADQFSVTKDIIRKLKAGDTYFHIRVLYNIGHNYLYDFSEATVHWVCRQILKGKSDRQIVEDSSNSNLKRIEVKRIRYKIRYKHISDEYF